MTRSVLSLIQLYSIRGFDPLKLTFIFNFPLPYFGNVVDFAERQMVVPYDTRELALLAMLGEYIAPSGKSKVAGAMRLRRLLSR